MGDVKVEVAIRFYDEDGDPVEGLRVDLEPTYGILDGFVGELVTDDDGCVTFSDVNGWTTYTVWVDHEKFDEIGLEGDDDEFEFEFNDPYKETSAEDDDEEDKDEEE